MSDLSRRDFLIGMALATVGTRPAFAALSELVPKTTAPKLAGRIIGTSYLGDETSSVFSFDLGSGALDMSRFSMKSPHDAIKVGDSFIALPKASEPAMVLNSDKSSHHLVLRPGMAFSGHALHDEKNARIIATAYDYTDRVRGYFVIIDPATLTISDMFPDGSYNAHDICFLDEDTIALCAYNAGEGDPSISGLNFRPYEGHSQLILYDRNTLKQKKVIRAFNDAVISHLVVTNEKKIFAIGSQEYNIPDIETKAAKDWERELKDYFMHSQPQLKDKYVDIINHIVLHRVEKSTNQLGLPLPNLMLGYGADEFKAINANPQYHRRAQSVCYNKVTDMVGVSYPNTDGVLLINAKTQGVQSLGFSDTGLSEVRGITPVDESPYMIASGHKRDLAVIDTRNAKVVGHYEAPIGRVVHLHYSV